MKNLKRTSLFILLILSFASCKKNDLKPPLSKFSIITDTVKLNPSGYAPLTATISVETSLNTRISIHIAGNHGAVSDVSKDLSELSKVHVIPVLGLYAGQSNTVELTFKDSAGGQVGKKSYSITTAAMPANFPNININVSSPDVMAEGMTFVSYFGHNGNPFPNAPFIYDDFGDIRWYADFISSPFLNTLFFDNGMEQLKNGNLYFGDGETNNIYEMDFLGNIVNTWPLPGYNFHHEVKEKPNGNFLVTVSKIGAGTIEDYIIEIDRSSKQIINTWDLNKSLQYGRRTLFNNNWDWIHVNAIIYDESDNSIIISGRTQGVVKLDNNNNVVWIMGCHKGWGTAGNGIDLRNFLLQPLDKNNQPITDQGVLDGNTNHPDFEWNWYQHAPLLMPNGHIMLFDNGWRNRNFSGSGQYSRAVEYEINKAAKTIKQIWTYGKERGAETLSEIVSDVDFISSSNHVIFSPGSVRNGTDYGKVIELDYNTKNILYEVTITPPSSYYTITFHRTERMKLYERPEFK